MHLGPDAILDSAVLADPYPFYAQLRKDSPVWKVPGIDLAYVASTRHIVDALRRVDDFSNNLDVLVIRGDNGQPVLWPTAEMGGGTTTLATADPPEHTRHRSLVFPELVARQIASIGPLIDSFVDEHLAAARASGASVEWTSALANPVPARVIGHVIGLPAEDWPQVMHWAMAGTSLLSGEHDVAGMAKLGEEATETGVYLATKLIEAAENPGDDLLGICAAAVVSEELTIEEAVGTLVILLGAGGESTASLIGNAVRMLAEDPDLQNQLRSNNELIEPFLEEALRLESPFKGHFRQVRRDCELGGVALSAGTTVLLLWASANRDADEFDQPDQVVLDRKIARSHLAFGRGIHHCVGAVLARTEAASAIERLLTATTSFALDPDDAPHWENSLFVRRHQRLPVVVDWN